VIGHESGLRGQRVAAERQDVRVIGHVLRQLAEHLPDHPWPS
jgi:hypothetical protein